MSILLIVINFIIATVLSYIFSRHSTKKMVQEIERLQLKNIHLRAENMILIECLDELAAQNDSLEQQIVRMHEKYNKLMMDNLNMRYKLGLPPKDENNTFDGDF